MNISRLMRRMTRRTDASGAMAPEYVVIIIIPAFFLGLAVYNSGRTVGSTFDILSGETAVPTYPMSYGTAGSSTTSGGGTAGSGTTSSGGGVTAPTYSPLGPLFVNEAGGTTGGTAGGTTGGTTSGTTGGTTGGTTSGTTGGTTSGTTSTTIATTATVVPPTALLTPYVDNRATLNGAAMAVPSSGRYGNDMISYQGFSDPNGLLLSSAYAGNNYLIVSGTGIPYMPTSFDRVFEITSTSYNLRTPTRATINNLDFSATSNQGLQNYAVKYSYFMDLNNTPFGTSIAVGTIDLQGTSGSGAPRTFSGAYNYSSYFSLTTKVTYTIPAWASGFSLMFDSQYQAR